MAANDTSPALESSDDIAHADRLKAGCDQIRAELRKLIVREVMGPAMPQVPSTAAVERVTYILSHESPAVFVDMGNGKLEVLTKFDLMDTIAGLVGQVR